MTVAGWIEIALFAAILTGLTPCSAAYLARVFTRRARRSSRACSGRSSGRSTACSASTRPGARTGSATRARCSCSAPSSASLLYADPAHAVAAPVQPAGLGAGTWDVSFNTAASFLTNTNWQFYGGETTMSYFSQMAGLAVQNFVSAGVGLAVLVAFVRALASRSGKGHRRLLVDLTRAILYVLLPGSCSSACSSSPRASSRRSGTAPTPPASPARRRPSPSARSPARRRSRCSGRTAAASSTSTRRCRSRTRPGSRTSPRCSRSWPSPPALTSMYGRMVGNRRQGWMVFGAMMTLFLVARGARLRQREPARPPAMHAAGLVGRQPGGQGAALRHRLLRAVRGRDHRRVLRRGERRDGVAERARRRGPDGAA